MLSWCKYQRQIYEIRTKIIFKNQQTVRTLEKGGKKSHKIFVCFSSFSWYSFFLLCSLSHLLHPADVLWLAPNYLIHICTDKPHPFYSPISCCIFHLLSCLCSLSVCLTHVYRLTSWLLFYSFCPIPNCSANLLPSFSFLFKCTNWLTRMCFLNSVFTFCLFLQLLQNVQFG